MMFTLLFVFLHFSSAIDPLELDFNVTLDFDPLDPDFEQHSRIHIWSPSLAQTVKTELISSKNPSSTSTWTPTPQPSQKPIRLIHIKKVHEYDEDELLDRALMQRQETYTRVIKIYLLESRMFVPKFESELINRLQNDYVIISKKPFNNSDPLIYEYYGAAQLLLQKSSTLMLIIVSEDWRNKAYLFANAIRQWLSQTIELHKESEVLQIHFTDSLLITIKGLPSSMNLTANQLSIFRCMLKTFKGKIGLRVTREDAPDELFADSLVMEFIRMFALNSWSLTWNTLHHSVREMLTTSDYALSGMIPDVDDLVVSVDCLFKKYHQAMHDMFSMIKSETHDFSLTVNHTVDDVTEAVRTLAEFDTQVMILLDPLMIGNIIHDLQFDGANDEQRDISIMVLSKAVLNELHRFLEIISQHSSQGMHIEYFAASRRPTWQKRHAFGGFAGFNVNKMSAPVNKVKMFTNPNNNTAKRLKCLTKKPKGKKKKKLL